MKNGGVKMEVKIKFKEEGIVTTTDTEIRISDNYIEIEQSGKQKDTNKQYVAISRKKFETIQELLNISEHKHQEEIIQKMFKLLEEIEE